MSNARAIRRHGTRGLGQMPEEQSGRLAGGPLEAGTLRDQEAGA
jgi:hypothetical protein